MMIMSKKENYEEKKIKDFGGPYINQYLSGMAIGSGLKIFNNIDEAIEKCLSMQNCSGITMSRQGKFTLRFGKKLKNSNPNNKFKNKEITWVKKDIKELPDSNKNFIDEYQIEDKIKGKKEKKEDIYEIIKYNKKLFYYNCSTQIAYLKENMQKYKMRRGKLIMIE